MPAVSTLSKKEGSNNFISNRILALSPVDLGPLRNVCWKVDFKSSWVAKSVIRELGAAEDNETHQQIRIFRHIPEARALAGWMLEPLVHRYIADATNNFLLFNMNSNGADPPHFTLVRDSPVPDHEQFIKVEREIVRLQSITNLSSCLNNNSYYVPNDPNFPLFDAFTIELDHVKKSAILWVLQMTTSRKHGGSAKGYQKIREIVAVLKDELGEEPPPKKSKMATGQAAPEPLVQVRYLLVVPKDESQSQNLQWDFPKGWSQNREKNDHCGNVYCLEVPLAIGRPLKTAPGPVLYANTLVPNGLQEVLDVRSWNTIQSDVAECCVLRYARSSKLLGHVEDSDGEAAHCHPASEISQISQRGVIHFRWK